MLAAAERGASRPRRSFRRAAALLLLPSLLLAGGPLTVLLATDVAVEPDLQALGLIVAALPLATPLLLRLTGRRSDRLLLGPAWVLCALGLIVIARVQPDLLPQQLLWIVVGWSAFIALAGFPPLLGWLRRYRYLWLTAGLLLAVSTLVLGDDVTGQGARLWLRLGPVTVQPAEVLRVLLIAFLAAYLAQHREGLVSTWRSFGPLRVPPPDVTLPLLAVVGVTLLIVVAQRDFGPAVIFVASFLAMLYLATGRRDYAVAALGAFLVGGLAAYAASPRLQVRIDAWLDPWADPYGTGYQSLQAIGGFVFGGVAGTGPGYGYPGLVPAAHTDYPLAVIGEEWGLIGSLAVILLYGLLVAHGLARVRRSGDAFGQLLGAGLAISLGVQVLVVLGGVLRLVPLTGITSPFLSYGGSSMVMGWVMLALLLRASSAAPPPEPSPGQEPASLALPAITGRARHAGIALLAGFVVLAGALGYWSVLRAEALATEPAVSGERLQLESARITRGRILDRDGEVLAETVAGPGGVAERVYHLPSAVHVVGFNSPRFGASGAEAAAADALVGRMQQTPADTLRALLRETSAGADVQLTIDADLQRVAAQAMGGASGAVVALDPRSGDVLAMVSNPGFDPVLSEEAWEALRSDPDSPLLNRATQGLYTPGSTFKTVTLAAALEHGLVTATDPAECPEQIFVVGVPIVSRNEPPGRTTQTVADAYAYSCNTFFAELGVELGEDRLAAAAGAFGLDEEVPFDLPTSRGRLRAEADFLDSEPGLAATAFGQGQLQFTPLHLALVAAAVANDGEVPRPRLFLDDPAATWRRAMSPDTAVALAGMMQHGVEAGWASTAALPGVSVAGKTGSAEVAEGEAAHALFIAFAPVEEPSIAVAVVKEHAGAGSAEAGPVARAVIEAWLASASAR